MTGGGMSYEGVGVSLAKAEAIVERLRRAVDSTRVGIESIPFGSFAGVYPIDERHLLAASMDGVGTKLMLQRRADKLRWGGADLAAHCINDVL
ncbi:MAG: phosphoribosylformylglycinamidine cyclo-ligase, partial [Gaiellaceae bacterium]